MRNWTLAGGRFISDEDNANLAAVVVLGQSAVEDLFGRTWVDPVGQTIRLNRQTYMSRTAATSLSIG